MASYYIIFSGDRKSLTVKIGRWLKKVLGAAFVVVSYWDGYPSMIYTERRKY